ncbi:hypothetical protein AKJ09_06168 [Labilithrix luteola]|uniref:Type IV fimbrial biogenesis protein PilY1 n=1 Tax=Labilithrix luteola TaxID=1391654 RepID=A0A0K1Q292_9BACT|nr:hypothetical protein [Labilithrix luteola]AKU99504.1 hypothetical protein AKJ09_06168 [Labilithrix luteola]
MKSMRWWGLFACALVPMIACAESDENAVDVTPPPVEDHDGGRTEQAAPDASADVAAPSDGEAPSSCTSDGFCRTSLPEHRVLRGVWGDGNGVVWAVGFEALGSDPSGLPESVQGNVLRWDGAAWSVVFTTPGALYAVWGSSPTDLWIGGEDGLFHGEGPSSAAITWTASPQNDGVIPVRSIWGSGPRDVWAVGSHADYDVWPFVYRSRVLHYSGPSTNPEQAWSLDPVSDRDYLFDNVWGTRQGEVWIGGDQWETYPFPPALVLHKPQGGDAGGGDAGGGDGWTAVALAPDSDDDVVYGITGGTVLGDDLCVLGWLALSQSGSVWTGKSDGNGQSTWKGDTSSRLPFFHFAAWGTSTDDFYVAGQYGRLRHFHGARWEYPRISVDGLPITNDFYSMWGLAGEDLWLVGDNVAIRKQLRSFK